MRYVRTEILDHIATVTIDRPERLNALSKAVLEELHDSLVELTRKSGVRALILTGAGSKAFVAGADVAEMRGFTPFEARSFAEMGQAVFSLLERSDKPTIAAVNGYALGGGCELAIACDFRIASSNARFGQPETGLGITPGFGATQRLPRLIGYPRALELILTGRQISASEALDLGLVNEVVELDELMNRCREVALQIAEKAPIAVRLAKNALARSLELSLTEGLKYEAMCFAMCFATDDQKEGMTAFLEKRPPVFKGK